MNTKNIQTKRAIVAGIAIASLVAILTPILADFSYVDAASAEKSYVRVNAKNALYEPAAGKTNVFGPNGVFPFFNDVFKCDQAQNFTVLVNYQTDALTVFLKKTQL